MAKSIDCKNWQQWEKQPDETAKGWLERTGELLNQMIEASLNVDTNKTLVGIVYSHPYADSRAWYLVVKDNPLTLEHIPCCDAWQLPDPHIRGMSKQDIINSVEFARFLTRRLERRVLNGNTG